MKKQVVISEIAFSKPIKEMIRNRWFLQYLIEQFHISRRNGQWVQYDPAARAYSPYPMDEITLRWLYESYLNDDRLLKYTLNRIHIDEKVEARLLRHGAIPCLEDEYEQREAECEKQRIAEYRRESFPLRKLIEFGSDDVIRIMDILLALPEMIYERLLQLSDRDLFIVGRFLSGQIMDSLDSPVRISRPTQASIAQELGISPAAVNKRLNSIYQKLYGLDRSEAKQRRRSQWAEPSE